MNLSPNHLRRYKQIATLFWKYGRSDLVKQMAVEDAFDTHELKDPPPDAPVDGKADQLVDDLEAMGPTYVKLGQILAGRPDLLPDAYLKALARLQDKVKPFPYEEVEKAILTELGVRVSKAFAEFGAFPIGAASLGQVHQAALRDGMAVVVKVQRPNIRPIIAEDFEVLTEIAAFLEERTEFGRKHRLSVILAEFRTALQTGAELRARGPKPGHDRQESGRVQTHPRTQADPRLQHAQHPDDGADFRPQDHRAQSAGAPGSQRRRTR